MVKLCSALLSFWLRLQLPPLWSLAKQVFGWEGFSFVVLFGFALVFLEMKKLRVARGLFVVSAVALVAKLMSSSETYLPSDWAVHGKWASVLISAFFLAGMLYWVSVEGKKQQRFEVRTANGGNTKQRDFIVERLTDFIREASQSNKGHLFPSSSFIEVGLWEKIEKFLEIHLPTEVERFKGKGIDAVEEIIKNLLDGSPAIKQLPTEARTAPPPKLLTLLRGLPVAHLVMHTGTYTFSEGRDGAMAIVATFRNEPEQRCSIQNVGARIVYFCSNGLECGNISHGTWLGEKFNHTNFEIGRERTLVLGVMEDSERIPGTNPDHSTGWRKVRLDGLSTIKDNRSGSRIAGPNKAHNY